jgi:phospholipid/cholesterol/gamma-HCH transport system substrate-binding protein
VSRHLTRLQSILLGLIIVAGLGLGLYGLFQAGARNGLDHTAFPVRVAFADINGVEVGTRVRVQGMDAGEVEAILPPAVPGDKVVLRLRVAGRYRHLVTADARVQITTETLLTGKIVRILPGSSAAAAVPDDGELSAVAAADLADGLAQAAAKLNTVLSKVDASLEGDGTLAKLAKSNEVYAEAMSSLQDVRKLVKSVQQNSDAIKSLPLVRSYVVDPNNVLMRPDCKRYRKWFAEDKLFDPGTAVLTATGKKLLDEASGWLNKDKESSQDVVVAGFADPSLNPEFALTLTQKQSQAVMEYLKNNFRIHRTGFWFWSNRSVRSIGVGNNPPPVPESESLPAARIELLVFVPQG